MSKTAPVTDSIGLILASASPRRRELLAELLTSFRVEVCPQAEPQFKPAELEPCAWVESLAYFKAAAVSSKYPNDAVLGADTIVVCEGHLLGKPDDLDDARRMLTLQMRSPSDVLTGVCLLSPAAGCFRLVQHELTRVWMRNDDRLREEYLATGDWRDKAGAYGIQTIGDRLVERIEGSFSNVVGLPLERVSRMLHAVGIAHRPPGSVNSKHASSGLEVAG